ncbi:BTB domain-containing protein [Caerostris extrusa]|uniref:BTB domain-containing protein n=1 Tax=Caerostris extrusa TaxID=172846 RepID=A0AAV4UH51_CAEEX|nr:BTB domain-containing protein [Caerostris extrusa]
MDSTFKITERKNQKGLCKLQQDLLQMYLYTDELKVTSLQELMEVGKAAHTFQVSGLIKSCKHYLATYSINEQNVWSAIEILKYFKMETLLERCLHLIQSIPQEVRYKVPELLQMNHETLTFFLRNREHVKDSDMHAMECIIRWLQHHDKRYVSLLSEIHIFSLTCDEFLDVIEKYPTFFNSREISRIVCNMIRPGIMNLPPWCEKNLESTDRDTSSDYHDIISNSLVIKTDCNRTFPKSVFLEEDGFEVSAVFEIKLTSCFPKSPYLVMFELAFGSSYIPEENLEFQLFRYEQGTFLKKRKIDFSLENTGENYYVVLSHAMLLQKNHPFVFSLRLKANGLKKWGSNGPVSSRQYRAVNIPEDIFYNMCLSTCGQKTACLSPLSDWTLFIDPKCGEKAYYHCSIF